MLSLSEALAKILVSQENGLDLAEIDHPLLGKQLNSSLTSNHVFLSGKMLREHSAATMAETFGQLSKPLPTLGAIDLNGNLLIHAGFYPKIESGYTLSDILETDVDSRYFLSEKQVHSLTTSQIHSNTQVETIEE
jgi:hypothetical protein